MVFKSMTGVYPGISGIRIILNLQFATIPFFSEMC
jgi:hypothetical protein